MRLPLNGILLIAVVLINGQIINAWMGQFNRNARDILPPIGYQKHSESHINDIPYHSDPQNEIFGVVESVVENEPCFARKCTSNEACCPGSVCVNIDGEIGNCLFLYGRKIGDLCYRSEECETGLTCEKGPDGITLVCLAPMVARSKQFGEDCITTDECDITRGLCCQLHRRHHRGIAKKVCNYIRDPLTCIDVIPIEDEIALEKGLGGIRLPFLNGYN